MTGAGLRRVVQALALALVLGLFGVLVWRLAENRGAELLEAGDAAPEFTLPRLDGEGELRLSGLRGKVVVLNFWASWCKPCEEEAPVLEQTWTRYRRDGLVVVGAGWKDIRSDARRFAREYGITYPLVDDGEDLTRAYGITGVPETFVIDRRGRIVGVVVGGLNAREEWRRRYDDLVQRALRT